MLCRCVSAADDQVTGLSHPASCALDLEGIEEKMDRIEDVTVVTMPRGDETGCYQYMLRTSGNVPVADMPLWLSDWSRGEWATLSRYAHAMHPSSAASTTTTLNFYDNHLITYDSHPG